MFTINKFFTHTIKNDNDNLKRLYRQQTHIVYTSCGLSDCLYFRYSSNRRLLFHAIRLFIVSTTQGYQARCCRLWGS